MKQLARWAARFASPGPRAVFRFDPPLPWLARVVLGAALLVVTLAYFGPALADGVAQAPVADNATGGLISLWGPLLGVVSALVLFFDRLAKVIPNGTTSAILNGIRLVATVLGVKVADRK